MLFHEEQVREFSKILNECLKEIEKIEDEEFRNDLCFPINNYLIMERAATNGKTFCLKVIKDILEAVKNYENKRKDKGN